MNSSRKPQSVGSEESEKFGNNWKDFREGPYWKGKKKDTKGAISQYAPNGSSNHWLTYKSGKMQRKGSTKPWKNSALETKRDKQKCWLLFVISGTAFERLERLCKYLSLSIETPERPCRRNNDYIPVVKAKLK